MRNTATIDTRAVHPVEIAVPRGVLHGDLRIPVEAHGLVIFAHGSGSSRFSSRNRHVATYLNVDGFATLLLDLLTSHEEAVDLRTMEYRFDIPRLGSRVIAAIDWALHKASLKGLPIGCFGASTGAAAALIAAAERPDAVQAVVSRGGRPDLANAALERVVAPTLLIVGGEDAPVIDMNRDAMHRMTAAHVEIEIVAGATHLFEERGTLEQVERLASDWFTRYLVTPKSTRALST
ncbi:MAG TPA: dienelactone hydrolase family protein [Vicinamibacterales bacterium]|jgi:dienelactone hydrolase